MSDRRNDTTEPGEHDLTPPPAGSDPAPASYYYDDATGYEIYDPAEDDEQGDDEDATGDETDA